MKLAKVFQHWNMRHEIRSREQNKSEIVLRCGNQPDQWNDLELCCGLCWESLNKVFEGVALVCVDRICFTSESHRNQKVSSEWNVLEGFLNLHLIWNSNRSMAHRGHSETGNWHPPPPPCRPQIVHSDPLLHQNQFSKEAGTPGSPAAHKREILLLADVTMIHTYNRSNSILYNKALFDPKQSCFMVNELWHTSAGNLRTVGRRRRTELFHQDLTQTTCKNRGLGKIVQTMPSTVLQKYLLPCSSWVFLYLSVYCLSIFYHRTLARMHWDQLS